MKDTGMSDKDKTAIEINVDTFNEGGSYFVRTEIEVRSVTIHGPFSDPQSAQKLKTDQLARREQVSLSLKEHLHRSAASLSG